MAQSGESAKYFIIKNMAKDIQAVTDKFLTYNTKSEKSNTDQRFLVGGSQNVVINDQRGFGIRQGYSVQGDVSYEAQVIDSYVANPSASVYFAMADASFTVGQSFTSLPDITTLISAQFYLKKLGVVAGSITAIVKAHSGVYGTSSLPDGVAVATSDAVDVATITADFASITFNFSGGNQIHLAENTHYTIELSYGGASAGNEIHVAASSDNGGHDGNAFYSVAAVYALSLGVDTIFTINGITTTQGPVKASTEWGNSTGDDFVLKAFNLEESLGRVSVYIGDVGSRSFNSWETVIDSLTSVNLVFAPYWDDTEKIDRLLWCDGTPNLYDWSGATATLSSITANTITLEGTDTFGQRRFILTGTRSIRIKDDNGTWRESVYTGGEATTTLTGLASDLTAYPFSGGNLIMQKVITRTNTPDASFKVDFLDVIDNQLIAGSRTSNKIYGSKNSNIADFTYSTPRAVGEGFLLTLDGPGRGVGSLKGDIILFAGRSLVYKTTFNQITVGSSLAETIKVTRLKTTAQQSALHHNLIANVGNGLMWVGQDKVFYELFDASLAYNPDLRAVSDPIKPDFDATDFTGGHVFANKNRVYISAPASVISFIYEHRLENGQKIWFWQPPQTFPVGRFTVIDDLIHGHSSLTSDTYKLFDGYNDNAGPIDAVAVLARWNGGLPPDLKNANEMFNDGKITVSTIIDVTYSFDLDGGLTAEIEKQIDGSNENIIYPTEQDASLATNPLADVSLDGDITDDDTISGFRIIHEINETEFFDYEVRFATNDVDKRWEIQCHGSDASLSTAKATAIKN